MTAEVIVIGSLNVDYVVRVERFPLPGETLRGTRFERFVGGKGNNQAIAAARAGAQVKMVGCVGDDDNGMYVLDSLKANGVNTRHITTKNEENTGVVFIMVNRQGEKSIVTVPGANAYTSFPANLLNRASLKAPDILLLQMEIPLETNVTVAEVMHKAGGRVILNVAPAPPNGNLPATLWANIDVLVVNETEASQLSGVTISNESSTKEAAQILQQKGVPVVIITLGAKGALLAEPNQPAVVIPSFAFRVEDTTAAGDAFCGAFAAAIAQDMDYRQAVRFGCAAGALATTRRGAVPSLPYKADIEQLVKP